MKKVLLSLAVIAASGGYVAFENTSSPANGEIGVASSRGGLLSNTSLPSLTLGTSAQAAEPAQIAAPAPTPTPQPTPTPVPTVPPVTAPVATTSLASAAVVQTGITGSPTTPAPIAPVPAALPADLSTRRANAAASQSQQQNSVTTIASATLPAQSAGSASSASSSGFTQVAQTGLRNGTFRGPSENAYYGRVRLAAVVRSGQLQRIEILNYPSDRRHSQYLSSVAIPMLEQEAIQAQSANINLVSGATLTSEAFIRSLSGALSAARG